MGENRKVLPLIALFCAALLAVPVYWLATPKKDFSANEKRYLADFPDLAGQDVFNWTFSDEIEGYLADQLPMRDFLVGADAYFEEATGRQVASDIWVDRDGYLVERPVEPNADQLAAHLQAIGGFAQTNGAEVALIVPPSTGCIRQDRLPAPQRVYRDDEILGQIRDAALPGVTFIDLTADLSGDMFYRTDHHWRAQGAYAAYLGFAEEKGFAPLSPDDFTVTAHDGFYGTTYARSALWLTPPDSLEMWDCGARVEVTFSDEEGTFDSLFFPNRLAEHDQYPVFLDGDHPLATVRNLDGQSGRKLLVIKDSFADSMIPLLIAHYGEIVMVDLRYYRDGVSPLAADADDILVVYSLDHIVNDTNIGWLE